MTKHTIDTTINNKWLNNKWLKNKIESEPEGNICAGIMKESKLKQEISKNGKIVFANEKSFIYRFCQYKDADLLGFFMGSDLHIFLFEAPFISIEREYIGFDDFEDWKQSLNKDDSNV